MFVCFLNDIDLLILIIWKQFYIHSRCEAINNIQTAIKYQDKEGGYGWWDAQTLQKYIQPTQTHMAYFQF